MWRYTYLCMRLSMCVESIRKPEALTGWLVSELQGSAIFAYLVLGLQVCVSMPDFFCMGSGDWTQVLVPARHSLYQPCYLPGTNMLTIITVQFLSNRCELMIKKMCWALILLTGLEMSRTFGFRLPIVRVWMPASLYIAKYLFKAEIIQAESLKITYFCSML